MGLGQATGITISQPANGAGGGGTVTSVSGTGTALVGVTVNTPTTTPQIVLTVPTAPGKSVWGNTQATTAGPSYTTDPAVLTLTANSVTASTVTAPALLGNATTATTANNLPGGLLGAIPYQSAAGTTNLLNGSTSAATVVLTQLGNGTTSAAPGCNAITGTPGFAVFSQGPTLTGTVTTTAISNSAAVTSLRFRTTGNAPTIAAGAGAGTTPTIAIVAGSTGQSGQIQLTSGTPTVAGVIGTITFNAAISPAPVAVILMPGNAATALVSTTIFTTTPSTTAWTFSTGATAL